MNPPHSSPAFLASDRLSSRTRDILHSRLASPPTDASRTLSSLAYGVLHALIPALLPQDSLLDGHEIDLAAAVDQALSGPRDGWRFAELPPDPVAWEQALCTLDAYARRHQGGPVASLSLEERGTLLDRLADGQAGDAGNGLSPEQMQRWSADLRADVIEAFLIHPRAQEALGISANLNGGDTTVQGFAHVGPDTRESFEPVTTSPLATL